jgi:hypothetical protein
MKIIRNGVFETNSSSTHSISIIKYKQPKHMIIPRNAPLFEVEEIGQAYGDEYRLDKRHHHSEADKLRFIVNVIASYVRDNADLYGLEVEYGDNYSEVEESKIRRCYENLIKLNPFAWLKELVEVETNTEITFVKPDSNYFPFFETVYDDKDNLDEIFNCDWQDEKSFKEFMKNVIFNEGVIIENKDVPYGMGD